MSCSAVDEEDEDAKLVGINHARVASSRSEAALIVFRGNRDLIK